MGCSGAVRGRPRRGMPLPQRLRCLSALLLLLALPAAAATTAREGERALPLLEARCARLCAAGCAARPRCPAIGEPSPQPESGSALAPTFCRSRDHAAPARPAAQRGTAVGGVPPRLEPRQQRDALPLVLCALRRRAASDLAVSLRRLLPHTHILQACPCGGSTWKGGCRSSLTCTAAVAAAGGGGWVLWHERDAAEGPSSSRLP